MLRRSSQRGGVLVGRTAELDSMRGALDRLAGHPKIGLTAVALIGEPGVGKTRLLDELVSWAIDRGHVVLSLDADKPDRPLALWADALTNDTSAEREVRRLPADTEQGVVLVVDDVHRADEASVRLLCRLLHRPPQGRTLLAIAYRPRQASAHLRSGIADAVRAGTVECVEVRPLTLPDAAELVGRRGHLPCLWNIYRESGGNPRYLQMLARQADLGRDEAATTEPALGAELAALSTVARRVAQAAAILSDPFDPVLTAEVADLEVPVVLDALDELGRADVIRTVDCASVLTFRHALVRQTAYEAAEPGWRFAAHGRADRALARRGASEIVRATHVVRTAAVGDLEAVRILGEAARAVRFRAPERAAHWLRAALRLLPEHGAAAAEHRPLLMLGLARALALSGCLRESRDILHAVLRLLADGSDPLRERAIRWCGTIERLLGRGAESHARLLDAVTALPSRDGPESAALRLELAAGGLMRGKVVDGLDWAEQALRAIQRHSDPIAEATALAVVAIGSCLAGGSGKDRAGSVGQVDRAAGLIDAAVDDELAARMDAVVWVAWSEILHERQEDALRHVERGVRAVERAELRFMLPHLLSVRVVALSELGRLARALVCCDEAMDSGLLTGLDDAQAITLAIRCRIAVWVDGLLDAPSLGEAAFARPASNYIRVLAARMLAEARLAAGDPAGCLAMIDHVGGTELPAVGAWNRPDWYELLTRAELARQRYDDAGSWAGRAVVAAGRLGLPGRRGLATLAGAQVLGTFDPGAAAPSAAAAAVLLGSAGLHLEAARARLLAGSLLAASGEHDRAQAELTAARKAAAVCGATRLVRQAVSEQRRLAARSRRHHGTGPAPLTRREREVAGLVGKGLTNRQIAGRLFVTEKTVEMHVSRIFAKLGVATRAAAAGLLARDT